MDTPRKTLHLVKSQHQTFESYEDWLAETRRRGLATQVHVIPGVAFPLASARYSAAVQSSRIEGACFTQGISFGWLRTFHPEPGST